MAFTVLVQLQSDVDGYNTRHCHNITVLRPGVFKVEYKTCLVQYKYVGCAVSTCFGVGPNVTAGNVTVDYSKV